MGDVYEIEKNENENSYLDKVILEKIGNFDT
jgi:hypothetical protein